MWAFATLCDEFSVATRLFLKLELSPSRETLLHFFEQIRRAFPSLTRFRRRERGAVALDEEAGEDGQRRYIKLAPNALRFGHVSPPSREAIAAFAELILTHAPYHLSLSDLDYDSLEIAYAFDLDYCGNHDELVAETLLGESPLQAALGSGARRVIDCRPCLGFALSEDCLTQAYLEIKGRTSMYELRSGEYEAQPLSVYLTMRRYFRDEVLDLATVHAELMAQGEELAAARVVPQILRPLREAIASRR